MGTDWAALYREIYPDLVRFLHCKVWDAERARDLAQEAFVRALNHDPENPRAWLFAVASNLARDEARSALRRRRHLALLKNDPLPAHGREVARPDQELERAETVSAVRRALESLGERDREVLLLWNGGLDYREIAKLTGLAVGAVGTTLARARRRLVEAFKKEEGTNAASG
ncbi:RNA polymerase sigma factor YlaC [bacterium HR33]|nr:RNA polymerase sigma factor YlaC [bacterium HR33]